VKLVRMYYAPPEPDGKAARGDGLYRFLLADKHGSFDVWDPANLREEDYEKTARGKEGGKRASYTILDWESAAPIYIKEMRGRIDLTLNPMSFGRLGPNAILYIWARACEINHHTNISQVLIRASREMAGMVTSPTGKESNEGEVRKEFANTLMWNAILDTADL